MRENVPSLLAKSLFRGFALGLMLVLRPNNHVVLFDFLVHGKTKQHVGMVTYSYQNFSWTSLIQSVNQYSVLIFFPSN